MSSFLFSFRFTLFFFSPFFCFPYKLVFCLLTLPHVCVAAVGIVFSPLPPFFWFGFSSLLRFVSRQHVASSTDPRAKGEMSFYFRRGVSCKLIGKQDSRATRSQWSYLGNDSGDLCLPLLLDLSYSFVKSNVSSLFLLVPSVFFFSLSRGLLFLTTPLLTFSRHAKYYKYMYIFSSFLSFVSVLCAESKGRNQLWEDAEGAVGSSVSVISVKQIQLQHWCR